MDNEDKAIGSQLQLLRESKGLNQSQMVKRLNAAGISWSQATLSKIEQGARSVRLAEAPKVAWVLGVELDELAVKSNQLAREFDKAFYSERQLSTQLEELTADLAAARSVRRALQLFRELSDGKSGPYRVNGSAAWLLNSHLSDGTGRIFIETRQAVEEAGVPVEALQRAEAEILRIFHQWRDGDADMPTVSAYLSPDNQPAEWDLQYLHGVPVPEARNPLLDRLQSELYGQALEAAFPQVTYVPGSDDSRELEILGLSAPTTLEATAPASVD